MRHQTSIRRGYTLLEMLLAMGASTVLIAAMGSVIVLTSTAVPAGDSRSELAAQANAALQRVADDASVALAVNIQPDLLALAVPDRDGDGSPDIVVYQVGAGGLSRGERADDPDGVVLAEGVTSLTASPDFGLRGDGRLRSLRIALGVDSVGTLLTSAETLPRPSRP
ncbi:MAG: type II secretion system protein J [Phycisphaerales bacterium JB040]